MQFNNPVPPRPSAVDTFSAWRESLHMMAAEESQLLLGQLVNYIQRFQEVKVLDANGQIVTALAMPSGEGDATASGTTPFSVVASKITDSNGNPTGEWQCYIYQGDLRHGLSFKLQAITGLTTDANLATDPQTPAYRTLIPTDAIFLQLKLDNTAAVLSADICSWGKGTGNFNPHAEFGASGCYIELSSDGTYVQYVRLLIAYTFPDADGNPVVTQCLNDHLMLETTVVNGFGLTYPYIAPKGYPGISEGGYGGYGGFDGYNGHSGGGGGGGGSGSGGGAS